MDDRYEEIATERTAALSKMHAERDAARAAAWDEFAVASRAYDYGLWRNTAVWCAAAACVFLAKSRGCFTVPVASVMMVVFVGVWVFVGMPLLQKMSCAHDVLNVKLDAVHKNVVRSLDEIHVRTVEAINDEYVSLRVLHGEVGWMAARRSASARPTAN